MKIAVIGNGGGGKTTLSRKLAQQYNLKLTHVDSVQFLSGLRVGPVEETRKILNDLADEANWLIDGFGPLDVMERRFKLADKVIFVDFPLWRHLWWCAKRQIKSIWHPRTELPEGCNEASLDGTIRLYKSVWRVHTVIRAKLLEIFDSREVKPNMVVIRTLSDWNRVYSDGITGL